MDGCDLYTEKYKTLLREIKDLKDLYAMFMIGRLSILISCQSSSIHLQSQSNTKQIIAGFFFFLQVKSKIYINMEKA